MQTETDAAFWDRIADGYAKRPFPYPEATERKLAVTRSMLRPHHRLLDVGCGTGTLPLRLAPHAARVDGIDVSQAMIAIAEGKAAAAGVTNVSFRAEPAGTLASVADASYDCVTIYNLLHLVPDARALLLAARRILAPGGAFVSSTPCLGESWIPFRVVLPVARWLGKAPAVTVLSREELRSAVADAGFVDLQTPEVGGDARSLFLTARAP